MEEQLEYATSVLGKEINPADVFADGEHTDAIAVTKGKGFQGVVKRWGVRIQYGKAARSSKARVVGSIGPWTLPEPCGLYPWLDRWDTTREPSTTRRS